MCETMGKCLHAAEKRRDIPGLSPVVHTSITSTESCNTLQCFTLALLFCEFLNHEDMSRTPIKVQQTPEIYNRKWQSVCGCFFLDCAHFGDFLNIDAACLHLCTLNSNSFGHSMTDVEYIFAKKACILFTACCELGLCVNFREELEKQMRQLTKKHEWWWWWWW